MRVKHKKLLNNLIISVKEMCDEVGIIICINVYQ